LPEAKTFAKSQGKEVLSKSGDIIKDSVNTLFDSYNQTGKFDPNVTKEVLNNAGSRFKDVGRDTVDMSKKFGKDLYNAEKDKIKPSLSEGLNKLRNDFQTNLNLNTNINRSDFNTNMNQTGGKYVINPKPQAIIKGGSYSKKNKLPNLNIQPINGSGLFLSK
jgi:hypothetical protein